MYFEYGTHPKSPVLFHLWKASPVPWMLAFEFISKYLHQMESRLCAFRSVWCYAIVYDPRISSFFTLKGLANVIATYSYSYHELNVWSNDVVIMHIGVRVKSIDRLFIAPFWIRISSTAYYHIFTSSPLRLISLVRLGKTGYNFTVHLARW